MVELVPGHLIPLASEPWGVWRCAALRGAGFPLKHVLELAAPIASAAADRLLDLDAEATAAREDALRATNEALDALRNEGAWGDTMRRKSLLAARKALLADKAPTTEG